jgi:hypothetical protein
VTGFSAKMNSRKFKITVARIERTTASAGGEDVRLTFRFERGPIRFELPLLFNSQDFDDTEIVQVARSRLSEIFGQLVVQSENWKLSDKALAALAELNMRASDA